MAFPQHNPLKNKKKKKNGQWLESHLALSSQLEYRELLAICNFRRKVARYRRNDTKGQDTA